MEEFSVRKRDAYVMLPVMCRNFCLVVCAISEHSIRYPIMGADELGTKS